MRALHRGLIRAVACLAAAAPMAAGVSAQATVKLDDPGALLEPCYQSVTVSNDGAFAVAFTVRAENSDPFSTEWTTYFGRSEARTLDVGDVGVGEHTPVHVEAVAAFGNPFKSRDFSFCHNGHTKLIEAKGTAANPWFEER
ncbi:hypothetical protein AB0H34_43350 [Saccharopolyspora shandongensis]|uniref:hypothetical protein n=1 Tax=Saccharopolyspora shandongensis TaxID=418495 RepID=UPI00340E02AE